jgi:hypothetical protein
VAVDLPHYQHHQLQSYWHKNLGLEAVIMKTAAKVGVAPHPCPQMCNISPSRSPNPLQFLVFDTETADEPILHEKSQVPLTKTVLQLLGGTSNSQLT